ncbi:MAG: Hpt domain-containing protein [Desulfocapsaceae bacterium]|nr:Hpt domain-containing protein [Desulfocapsaceae bacterium]
MGYISFSTRIKEYLGNQFDLPEDQIESMLPEFRKTLAIHMENLKAAQNSNDLDELQGAAHTMKGALLNLGLNDCAELALEIESGAAAGDGAVDYSQLITRIDNFVMEIVEE